jgi:hypothetical protein
VKKSLQAVKPEQKSSSEGASPTTSATKTQAAAPLVGPHPALPLPWTSYRTSCSRPSSSIVSSPGRPPPVFLRSSPRTLDRRGEGNGDGRVNGGFSLALPQPGSHLPFESSPSLPAAQIRFFCLIFFICLNCRFLGDLVAAESNWRYGNHILYS